MGRLKKFFENSKNIKVVDILKDILREPDVQGFIISLNTQDQLFDEGVNYEDVKLSVIFQPYQPSTVERKTREGLPTYRVTLFDSGRFYASFMVRVNNDASVTLSADTTKAGGIDLQDRYGNKIVGLSQESLSKLSEFIAPKFKEAFLAEVFRGV